VNGIAKTAGLSANMRSKEAGSSGQVFANFLTQQQKPEQEPSQKTPPENPQKNKTGVKPAQVRSETSKENDPTIKRYGLDIHVKYLETPCDNINHNCNQRPPGTKIDGIMVHDTVVSGPRALLWFSLPDLKQSTPTNRVGPSTHYFIARNGDVYLIVEEEDRAWHAGKGNFNDIADKANDSFIGIELENEWPTDDIMKNCTQRTDFKDQPNYTEAQIKSFRELVKGLIKERHIAPENIFYHSDYRPKDRCDPGIKFPAERLARDKIGLWPDPVPVDPKGLTHKSGQKDSDTEDSKGITSDQQLLMNAGYTSVNATGVFDAPTEQAVKAFKFHYMPDSDLDGTTIDPLTRAKLQGLVSAREKSQVEWRAAEQKRQKSGKTAGLSPSHP
jgi:N-acetylmuramoyl-L-alanine amidase